MEEHFIRNLKTVFTTKAQDIRFQYYLNACDQQVSKAYFH